MKISQKKWWSNTAYWICC